MEPRILTPEELAIVTLDPDLTYVEISRRLKMTRSCAISLCYRARRKLGVKTRAGATMKLLRQGKITIDQITFKDRA